MLQQEQALAYVLRHRAVTLVGLARHFKTPTPVARGVLRDLVEAGEIDRHPSREIYLAPEIRKGAPAYETLVDMLDLLTAAADNMLLHAGARTRMPESDLVARRNMINEAEAMLASARAQPVPAGPEGEALQGEGETWPQ